MKYRTNSAWPVHGGAAVIPGGIEINDAINTLVAGVIPPPDVTPLDQTTRDALVKAYPWHVIAPVAGAGRRPCGVVVSAQGSLSDLKLAPILPIASSVLSKSRVDRASLSSLHTTSVSPSLSAAMAFASWGLSLYAPLI